MSEAAVIARRKKNRKERQFDVSSLGKITLLLFLMCTTGHCLCDNLHRFSKKKKTKITKAFLRFLRQEERNKTEKKTQKQIWCVHRLILFISGPRQKCRYVWIHFGCILALLDVLEETQTWWWMRLNITNKLDTRIDVEGHACFGKGLFVWCSTSKI